MGHFPTGREMLLWVRQASKVWAGVSAPGWSVMPCLMTPLPCPCVQVHATMQHYGVNGYSLHAMNSLSAMYNLHQQAAQQAQHAPDYRPSVHALTLAERLAGKGHGDSMLWMDCGGWGWRRGLGEGKNRRKGAQSKSKFVLGGSGSPRSLSNRERCQLKIYV